MIQYNTIQFGDFYFMYVYVIVILYAFEHCFPFVQEAVHYWHFYLKIFCYFNAICF